VRVVVIGLVGTNDAEVHLVTSPEPGTPACARCCQGGGKGDIRVGDTESQHGSLTGVRLRVVDLAMEPGGRGVGMRPQGHRWAAVMLSVHHGDALVGGEIHHHSVVWQRAASGPPEPGLPRLTLDGGGEGSHALGGRATQWGAPQGLEMGLGRGLGGPGWRGTAGRLHVLRPEELLGRLEDGGGVVGLGDLRSPGHGPFAMPPNGVPDPSPGGMRECKPWG